MRHPLLLPIEKNVVYNSAYVKTTMRMLTILQEWMRVHLRKVCLLFTSAIKKSSLTEQVTEKPISSNVKRRCRDG